MFVALVMLRASCLLLVVCCLERSFFFWEASGSVWAASGKRLAAFWEAPWKLGSFWDAHRSSVLLLASCLFLVVCCLERSIFFWEASGGVRAASGQRFATVWEAPWKLGSFWEASLEASGKLLGASGKLLETFGKPLGSFWEASGSVWEASGKLFLASGKSLESFERLPGTSGKPLGSFEKPRELLGSLWEASGNP